MTNCVLRLVDVAMSVLIMAFSLENSQTEKQGNVIGFLAAPDFNQSIRCASFNRRIF